MMMRTALPALQRQARRWNEVDPVNERQFPGLGMEIKANPGYQVAWEDEAGHTFTTATYGVPERAAQVLVEIAASDEDLNQRGVMARMPQRRNLRIVRET